MLRVSISKPGEKVLKTIQTVIICIIILAFQGHTQTMINHPQNNAYTLRSRNPKTPSKGSSKAITKKVLKSKTGKRTIHKKEAQKAPGKDGKAVVWKSSRGRTQEKEWSHWEEQKLFALHDQLGNRWTIISKEFANKTDNDIKNHLFSRFRLAVRRINKIAVADPTSLRPLKMSIISKIVAVCDSRFVQNAPPTFSLIKAALRLKGDLLAFLYENPFNSPPQKTQKLIKELHVFSQSFSRCSRNSQGGNFSEDQGSFDLEENLSHQEGPLMGFQKEGESQPTRLQDSMLESESIQLRLPHSIHENFNAESLMADISTSAGNSTILSPGLVQRIFVGDRLSIHCAESLLPPIGCDEAYQYDANKCELDLFDFLALST